jgi:hypothetical protein
MSEAERALLEAGKALEGVTPGEWLSDEWTVWGESITDESGTTHPVYGIPVANIPGDYERRWGRRHKPGEREANMAFIAYAHRGVPALATHLRAALDREAKLLEALKAVLNIPAVRQAVGINHTPGCNCPVCKARALVSQQEADRG